jgi:hypothetical protein
MPGDGLPVHLLDDRAGLGEPAGEIERMHLGRSQLKHGERKLIREASCGADPTVG